MDLWSLEHHAVLGWHCLGEFEVEPSCTEIQLHAEKIYDSAPSHVWDKDWHCQVHHVVTFLKVSGFC